MPATVDGTDHIDRLWSTSGSRHWTTIAEDYSRRVDILHALRCHETALLITSEASVVRVLVFHYGFSWYGGPEALMKQLNATKAIINVIKSGLMMARCHSSNR